MASTDVAASVGAAFQPGHEQVTARQVVPHLSQIDAIRDAILRPSDANISRVRAQQEPRQYVADCLLPPDCHRLPLTKNRSDRTREKLVFDDIFTNTATGFSFRDTANFTRVFDHASGIMVLHGIFWKTMVDEHIVVLDVGSFTLNLNLPFPQPVENLKGANHDVNSAPFGTWSYCDWLGGIFPVAR